MEDSEAAPVCAGHGVGTETERQSSESASSTGNLPRAAVVWGAFLAASVGAITVLQALGPADRQAPPRAVTTPAESPSGGIVPAAADESPRILPRAATVARGHWRAIVVYDSGSPAGDAASLERRHSRAGLAGLGHHFVIGNGQGMDDGQVAVGFRWDHQLPGAHAASGMSMSAGPGRPVLDASALNRGAISVCLIGNTDRRAPTDPQVRALRSLVRALRAEFGIDADMVRFRSELGPAGGMAGSFPLRAIRDEAVP
jgi:hypothetical protein